jgi:hypothetical protein
MAQDFILSSKILFMENDTKFPEQQAPEKNTDNAFVQVGKDGESVTPSTEEKKTDIAKDGNATTLEHR